MIAQIVLLAVAAVCAAAALTGAWLNRGVQPDVFAAQLQQLTELAESEPDEPSRIVRDLFREVVVVTLKTGETFRGVLVAADAHALLFREAAQLAARDAIGIDGELIVPRADIAYLQRP